MVLLRCESMSSSSSILSDSLGSKPCFCRCSNFYLRLSSYCCHEMRARSSSSLSDSIASREPYSIIIYWASAGFCAGSNFGGWCVLYIVANTKFSSLLSRSWLYVLLCWLSYIAFLRIEPAPLLVFLKGSGELGSLLENPLLYGASRDLCLPLAVGIDVELLFWVACLVSSMFLP